MFQINRTAEIDIGDRIRDQILSGELPLGSRLTLDLLASRYDAGHMPIREALRRLEGEGLVVLTPNRGARVRGVDVDFVRNVFDVRVAIESMLVRRAAERIEPHQIVELKAVQATYERAIAAKDYKGALSDNHEFHRIINSAAGNPEASEILDRHWGLIIALWNKYEYGENRAAGVIADHHQIIHALEKRDAEFAAAVAAVHSAKAKNQLLERMQGRAS